MRKKKKQGKRKKCVVFAKKFSTEDLLVMHTNRKNEAIHILFRFEFLHNLFLYYYFSQMTKQDRRSNNNKEDTTSDSDNERHRKCPRVETVDVVVDPTNPNTWIGHSEDSIVEAVTKAGVMKTGFTVEQFRTQLKLFLKGGGQKNLGVALSDVLADQEQPTAEEMSKKANDILNTRLNNVFTSGIAIGRAGSSEKDGRRFLACSVCEG